MNAGRWDRIQSLFHAAAELPRPEQRAFLESECTDDPSLVADALALLEEDANGASLLDRGVANVADEMLGRGRFTPAVEQFGPYRITKVLGEGGMGVVYLAERADLG